MGYLFMLVWVKVSIGAVYHLDSVPNAFRYQMRGETQIYLEG